MVGMQQGKARLVRRCGAILALGAVLAAAGAGAAPRVVPLTVAEVNVTHDPSYRWGEQAVAINPKNPSNLVLATVGVGTTTACEKTPRCQNVPADYGNGFKGAQARGMFEDPMFTRVVAFTSFDGGRSWRRFNVPLTPAGFPRLTGSGDPCVTAGPDGIFYVSFDINDWGSPEHVLPSAGVGVSKSSDGGRTWSVPVLSGAPVDGPKVTADLSDGTIYNSASTFLGPRSTGDPKAPVNPHSDRWLTSSRDGVHWGPVHPMGSGDAVSMAAANGLVVSAFRTVSHPTLFAQPNDAFCGDKTKPCTVFGVSADKGVTWLRHVLDIPNDYASRPGQPMVAADPARKGHFAVAIPMSEEGGYLVYQTHDSGATWSGPARVSDDPARHHFHGHMAYSPQGVLGIMWQTRLPAPGQVIKTQTQPGPGVQTEYSVWAAVSRDGGATFSAPFPASTRNSVLPPANDQGLSGDDYSNIVLWGDRVYVSWAAWHGDQRDNFVRALRLADFGR